MAFVQLETWSAPVSSRAAAFRADGAPVVSLPLHTALEMPLRRMSATAFSIVVHAALIWVLIYRLGVSPEPQYRDLDESTALAMFNLAPPGAAEPPAPAPAPAEPPALAPETSLDLSIPAALPVQEWSMTRIRVPRSDSIQTASADAAPGAAAAGAALSLRKFIGFGDGRGGELLLDKAKLEGARQVAVRAFPDARGTVMVFLRVSPAGVVLAVEIKGGALNRQVTAALSDALLGQKLFQVRVPVQESALVFLPPFSLGGET